jgi:L-2,4-diaminobutyric acid acetyltransferase
MKKFDDITLRKPVLQDGMAVHRLVANCPPLDPNSSYCNFLQCSHFAATSVAAEMNGELVGFISGYCPPDKPETLFIWQVAVSEAARGRGLAKRMLRHIVARPGNEALTHMETTITPDNQASWALFKAFADSVGTVYESAVWLDKEQHFEGLHDSEELLRIGPFHAAAAAD